MNIKSLNNYTYLFFIFAVFICYFSSFPNFIQGGDSAELSLGAEKLFVVHPPGYPLWIWLSHVWTRLFSQAFYHKIAILSGIYSLLTLMVLLWPAKKQFSATLFFGLPLAFSDVFYTAAVIPDVFSLHGLFVAAIMYLFLFSEDKRRTEFIIGLFILGFANHLTTIFLLPIVVMSLIENKRPNWLFPAATVLITVLLYLSLFYMNPESPFSWGSVVSFRELLNHIFRMDYGFLKLTPSNTPLTLEPLLFFIKKSLLQLWLPLSILAVCVLENRQIIKNKKFLVGLITFIFSCVFFFVSNIMPQYTGAEVAERFHLMPLIIVLMTCIYAFIFMPIRKHFLFLFYVGLIPLTFHCYDQYQSYSKLQNDSVIEDYSRNSVAIATAQSPSVIVAESDSAYFGLRYIIAKEFEKQAVVAVVPSLLFHPWYKKKIESKIQHFNFINYEQALRTRKFDFDRDVIEANISKINFFVYSGYQNSKLFNPIYYPLGQKLTLRQNDQIQLQFVPISIRHSYKSRPTGPLAFTRTKMFSDYAYYHLAQALEASKQNNLAKAVDKWTDTLNLVPYALPALQNICLISSDRHPRCSVELKESVKKESEGIF